MEQLKHMNISRLGVLALVGMAGGSLLTSWHLPYRSRGIYPTVPQSWHSLCVQRQTLTSAHIFDVLAMNFK